MLAGAFAAWFVGAGGSFRRPQVWLDAVTIVTLLLLGLWSFFLGPTSGSDMERISFGAIFEHSTAVAARGRVRVSCAQRNSDLDVRALAVPMFDSKLPAEGGRVRCQNLRSRV